MIDIRRIRTEDVALSRALRLRALKSDPLSFGSSYEIEAVRDEAFWAESAKRHAESDDCAIFIAFRGTEAVGLVRGGRAADRPGVFFIHSMWVAAEARRCGIATTLLRTVEDWIASKGGMICELMVTDAAPTARHLYERAGYVADGYTEKSHHGVMEHQMRKHLGTHLRDEQPGDAPAIRRVHEAAFLRAKEADIVERLVAAGAVSLSLVAVQGNDVVGHILFSPVTIDNVQVRAVGLAPMAILPAYQRQGVGSALVRNALDELRRAGDEVVVVLGHPAFYPRFGFVRASQLGLRWERDCPDEAFMALELRPGALAGRSGVVRYRPELG